MRVWVVEVGEPLPFDPGVPRLMRAGLLSETLASRGHDVTWWTAAFDHSRKELRPRGRRTVESGGGRYEVELLRSIGYRRHVSARRMVEHTVNAVDFLLRARSAPRPDVIVAGLPTLELTAACARLGRRWNRPVVVDVRDLWPDIFEAALPHRFRSVRRALLSPLRALARYACRSSVAITGVSEPFRDWGLRHARRAARPTDQAFPPAYRPLDLDSAARQRGDGFWRAHGLDRHTVVAFVGALSDQFEFEPVLDVARRWRETHPDLVFVLAGDGPARAALTVASRDLGNVCLPGWIDAEQIAALLARASIGLAPYKPVPNFLDNLTNKVVEYLAYSVPVVSTLGDGITGRIVREQGCGASYQSGDSSSLEVALSAVLADEAMASRAYETFESRYSAAIVYGRFAELLEGLAGTPGRRRGGV